MTDHVATRLTCFALVSAIEDDARSSIASLVDPGRDEFLPPDVRAKARLRWSNDHESDGDPADGDSSLLAYLDFADLSKAFDALAPAIDASLRERTLECVRNILLTSDARNRVCHSRPLETDDFPRLYDLARLVERGSMPGTPTRTRETMKRLTEDPTYVLHLRIPEFWMNSATKIRHNLPAPDFDDTGFIGRSKERREIAKRLSSRYPIVTIVGEGGIGKTSLALRCLYDLLDDEAAPFDAIVWVSLKTRALTVGGVTEIRGAIGDLVGLVRAVATESCAIDIDEDPIADIHTYMEQFRVLLAIDNVETLSTGSLRDLLSDVPVQSKVLLTSRIGLGELEVRYPLDALDSANAVQLVRKFSSANNLKYLQSAPTKTLENYVERLFRNPLLIKWFVSSVAAGAPVEKILSRSGKTFVDAVRFCFENLYERMSDTEKKLVQILAATRRPTTRAELAYLCDADTRDLELALTGLHNSSTVRVSISTQADGGISTYQLTDIASEFISKLAPPSPDFFASIQRELNRLSRAGEDQAKARQEYRYNVMTVHASNRDEIICASILRNALSSASERDFDAARRLVERAKELLPTFAECYRIGGVIELDAGETYRAVSEMEQAVSCDPRSGFVRYSFAQLFVHAKDHERALEQTCHAIECDGEQPPLITLKALCLTRLGRIDEAVPLYDELLTNLEGRPRRWRIATRDQAAEAHRRAVEAAMRRRDPAAAHEHFQRASRILSDAWDAGDYDAKVAERAERLLATAIASTRDDPQGPFEQDVERWTSDHESGRGALVAYRSRRPRLEHPHDDTAMSTPQSVNTGVLRGTIQSLHHSFGFILSESGQRWFFHASNVVDSPRFETLRGKAVTFHEGHNSKGPCAVRVKVVERDAAQN